MPAYLQILMQQLAQSAWKPAAGAGAISALPAPLSLDSLGQGARAVASLMALPPTVLFRWAGSGRVRSRETGLRLLPAGSQAAFVLYGGADEPLLCIARLETRPAFASFFHTFAGENGALYGIEPFASLPTLTTNHRPELLPEAAVHAAYRDFLDGPATHLLHHPWRHLQRRLKKMQSPPGIRLGLAHGGRQRDREEPITGAEKERLLRQYLALTYKELARKP